VRIGFPRGALAIILRHLFCTTSSCLYVEGLIEHQVGAAYVNVDRIVALYCFLFSYQHCYCFMWIELN
jgi:hypothetical protein